MCMCVLTCMKIFTHTYIYMYIYLSIETKLKNLILLIRNYAFVILIIRLFYKNTYMY